ncbi:hypothetical protein [Streptomyces shenzhenensis]|uniref:hypothetical protein n=1 Tax=Streptomyces shenzhenensis TaxID=943815 RepID=UPI00369C5172
MIAEHRQRLPRGEDVVDPETWAGSVPAAQGIAPRMRVGRSKWFDLLWLLPIGWGVQRIGFALIGPVQRLFEHVDATVTQWGGVSMATIMELVKPRPEAPAGWSLCRSATRTAPRCRTDTVLHSWPAFPR